MAAAVKDSVWIGISIGNIGSVYYMQGDFKKAVPPLMTDWQTSLKYNDPTNAGIALLRLSSINLYNNEFQTAERRLDSAEALIRNSKQDVLNTYIDFYRQKSILYEKKGLLQDALIYIKKCEAARDSLAKRDNRAVVERVKLQWETEKYRNQLDKIETIANIDRFKRNAIICIFFLIMIIVFLLFSRYRLNAKKDRQQLLIRKKRVDEQLKTAANDLKLFTENLKQNHILIEKFKAEIESLNQQSTNNESKARLEKLLQAHIMTDENWDAFKRLFTQVHQDFFQKLRSEYPNLTHNDMRLLSLIKLELSNLEMAGMLGITDEGIKKAKQRMRKKMQLTLDQSIECVLTKM